MKLSIITPSFNQGRFISGALKSVDFERKFIDIEHIILDNCSNDETIELLHQHQTFHSDNPNVKVIIERDRGQTNAINRGFAMASGDILCWLNTDERYKPGALVAVLRFFEAHPDVDVVFGDVEFVNENQVPIRIRKELNFSESMLLYYGCFVMSCATFIRRPAASKAGPLDESLKVVMDFEWYLRLSRTGARFAHIPHLIASFTWHETNISSTFSEKRKAERLSVQLRYSHLAIPRIMALPTYSALKYWWILCRECRRQLQKISVR